ncbi:MAG: protease, partial [Aeromicrobium sp.]|nr:protease [Aeromicrobium sp.]
MKRVLSGLVGLTLAASLGVAYASPGTASAPPASGKDHTSKVRDELPNPLEDKRRALRETGLTSVLNGDAKPVEKNGASVVKVGKG